MVRADILHVVVMEEEKDALVILKSRTSEEALPISIGIMEAQAIAASLHNISVPRPLTHDLTKNIIQRLNAQLVKVEITELRNSTFYALLTLRFDGEQIQIDARPSDALALALRFKADVYIDELVFEQAGVDLTESNDPQESTQEFEIEKRSEMGIQSLEAALKKSIREERYEDAARIRDEINARNNQRGGSDG